MGKASNSNKLSKEDIVSLYTFLDLFEKNIKRRYGDISLESLLNDTSFKNIQIEHRSSSKSLLTIKKSKSDYIHFIPKKGSMDKGHDLLRHIRNSIAHAFVSKKSKRYILIDYNDSGNVSMTCEIEVESFYKLIEKLTKNI